MVQKVKHFMDEEDIGSGERTLAQQEDMQQTARLREDQERAKELGHPQDGSHLYQIIEEQQYMLQQEGHIPRSAQVQADATQKQAAKEEAVLSAPQAATHKPATSSSSAVS